MDGNRRWTFGRAVLDERSLELIVDGTVVRVERKPLEVLLYLLHHAGEVVTKDELAEALWPGRILTETVLTRCVSQLRQVLHDDERSLIRTVHGFGYRLVADVKVEAAAPARLPVFDFKPGAHPPQRPQWHLVERLGAGGHGEAWLARHDKTQDARVFKFALDGDALGSLKREITLYRLLHDSLKERAAVVPIYEWNLEEPPYFIETGYVAGRDLVAWAAAKGGLASIPLERRLELAAQIAEALAAAHSVGVLHKDLKPGNVLVEEGADGLTRIRLSDFGSGGVLDPARLEALGITNHGMDTRAEGKATPIYVAPEIIGGQPFTVAADVYALGVMLYQLVIADLRRPLAPGWELDVQDELLREDIAFAAAGNPLRRLADAAQLAVHLRTLRTRHEARKAELAASERAARAQRVMRELRRTRVFAVAVFVLAVAAAAGGFTAYTARNDADAARATAQAINNFLTEGVLSVDPAAEKPKDASYESLLNRAASQVEERFAGQPEAAASIHWLLGRRFQELGRLEEAMSEYEKAMRLMHELTGARMLPALLSLDRLIPFYVERGKLAEAMKLGETLTETWVHQYGASDLSTLLVRSRIAKSFAQMGDLKRADREFRSVLEELEGVPPLSSQTRLLLKEFLGWILATDTSALDTDEEVTDAARGHITSHYAGYLGEFAEDYRQAATRYREVLPTLSRSLGDDSETVALAEMGLALVLAGLGDYEESDKHLARCERFYDGSLPPRHWLRAPAMLLRGRLELDRERLQEAEATFNSAMRTCLEGGCAPRLIEEIRYDLARTYDRRGDASRALEAYRQSLVSFELIRGPKHVGSLKRRLSLSDMLRRLGKPKEAATVLGLLGQDAFNALPAPHLVVAEYKRLQALLWLDSHPQKARILLDESLKIVEHRLGSDHRRTRQTRNELSMAIEGIR